uniref:NADH-ubiquinone oxidoreductase chain 5 n=1 Tax=Symbiochloris sp. SG-2018 TaxID=2126034 RepID=A0A976YD78_9CHLO|nr:NADH dehydrogenase subunit 5 [Symbiochloris sp. SG-2018]UVF37868.1 NADH dehydrogenase subunit 5 [Symbiochloris sp. SG-2018]
MYCTILLLPFLSALNCLMFGRYLGIRGAGLLATLLMMITNMLSLAIFYEVAICASPCTLTIHPWFASEMFEAEWGLLFDTLTAVMLVVVTSISALVHLYSISYMAEDPHVPRFMAFLSIFTFFMLMLVTADNFLQMFFGWEGVGLASYLLINFWFTRLQANKAAIQAMLMNRVGDFGLALGIMAIFYVFRSVDYITVFSCVSQYVAKEETSSLYLQTTSVSPLITINTICTLLFVGAIGKSAQLGLHTWLPSAMEGPTPVSALIHAATMVTAGVFLVARCSPIFEYAPDALMIVTFVGAMTCIFAATTGLVQNDMKRVIAYSTCSQLGYMILICGLSQYSVGVFHLMNHAFFKALLFLSAGSVIHALSDEQDMRKMGGIAQLLPFTYAMMFIGSLSLAGFPFLTGFYSKDFILELAQAKYSVPGQFAYWLGSICVFLTSYYSFRLLFLTFLTPTMAYKRSIEKTHDAPLIMALPLVLLALGSIFLGYLTKDMLIGAGTPFWGNALYTAPSRALFVEAEYISQFYKLLPFVNTLLGCFIAFIFAFNSRIAYTIKMHSIGRSIYYFLNKRWLFDKVYNDIAFNFLKAGYHITFKTLDKGVLETLGPFGIKKIIKGLLDKIMSLQSGYVYHYLAIMLLSLICFLGFDLYSSVFLYLLDYRLCFLWILVTLMIF